MDVTPLIRRDTKIIQSYKDGVFKISGDIVDHPVIVLSDKVLSWLQPVGTDVTVESFASLAEQMVDVEILLLGTGQKMRILPQATRLAIKQAYGFSIDAMDTGAACRTYNVLMAEGRKVGAALLPYK